MSRIFSHAAPPARQSFSSSRPPLWGGQRRKLFTFNLRDPIKEDVPPNREQLRSVRLIQAGAATANISAGPRWSPVRSFWHVPN